MKIYKSKLFILGALWGSAIAAIAAVPPAKTIVEMEEVSIEGERKIFIEKASYAYRVSDSRPSVIVLYRPSINSTSMWDHLVEMYDVAQTYVYYLEYFKDHPKFTEAIVQVCPLTGKNDTYYSYGSLDNGLATSLWKIEFQPWFKERANTEVDKAINPTR